VLRFGADVNLGNVAPTDLIALETLRLGLRSDTMTADTVPADGLLAEDGALRA
jgi:phosphosulfolactate synthase